jgi:hypothetical protein
MLQVNARFLIILQIQWDEIVDGIDQFLVDLGSNLTQKQLFRVNVSFSTFAAFGNIKPSSETDSRK